VSDVNFVDGRQHIRFPGSVAGIEEGGARLRATLDQWHVGEQARYNVELAFDEIASNIVRYSRALGDIDVTLATPPGEIELTFEDDGIAFDPRESDEPPTADSLDEARVGGLGLMLVRKIAVRLEYRRNAGRNRLILALANA